MKPVRVYTTNYCIYCRRAKSLLNELKIPFVEINVENDDDAREWLVEESGQRTVPQIFFGDESIGGFTELNALHRSGKLMQRLDDRVA